MTHSDKLKQARAEIEAVMERYDIAGHVVLHEPGFGEVFARLTPSYSQLHPLGPRGLYRLRSKREDYANREEQASDLEATVNMLQILADLLAPAAMHFIDMTTWISNMVGAEHGEAQVEPDGEPDPSMH